MDAEWTFFSLDVELTNSCAENCRMCPRGQLSRPPGLMTEEVFERLVVLIERFSSRVTFSGFGNPLLHPRWPEWLDRLRGLGLPAGMVLHPGALDAGNIEKLRRHPPSHLEVSFPSIDPGFFASLCPNSDYGEALARVAALHRLKLAPLVVVGLLTAQSPESAAEYHAFWRARGIRSRIFPCHSRGGHLLDPALLRARPVPAASCGLLGVHGFIAWNGEVLACCHDLTGATRFGSVLTDAPEDLARRKAGHAAGPPWTLCRACDEFRKAWPLPSGRCPQSPGERGRYLAKLTAKR